MKAIILAAGMGNRFGKYTEGRPKCLLEVGGISILERQIRTFRRLGINDIVVIKGFAADQINFEGVRYYIDEKHCYNMVYTLFCAEPELEGDIIISYADILFEDQVLKTLIDTPSCDVAVIVDTLWEEYYRERFEKPFEEAESLVCDENGYILNIGEARPEPVNVQGQYIGLIRLSGTGSEIFRSEYNLAKTEFWDKIWLRGRLFQKIYMTDFLQALIDQGIIANAVPIQHGWLEFDNVTDYEKTLTWFTNGTIGRFCSITLD